MCLVYSLFAHKRMGHKGDSPVFKMLSSFVSKIPFQFFTISLPGFLSVDQKNIDDFSTNFSRILPNTFFTCGMNGEKDIVIVDSTGSTKKVKRVDYINSIFTNLISLSLSPKKDHSKVIFFFKMPMHFNNNIKIIDYCFAILIGSSNQNNTCYFNPANAAYGESDVLLIKEDALNEIFKCVESQELEEKIVHYFEKTSEQQYLISFSKEIKESNIIDEICRDSFEEIKICIDLEQPVI